MPRNTADLKTLAVVLRRTNYGEADRILNLITPVGKIAVIAKGVRRARSKLAGGIEMFCLSEIQIHQGRGKLGVVTSARMVRHYSGILQSYERMELAGLILKKVSMAAEHAEGPEYFELTRQCLEELNNETNVALIESWFWLNLLRIGGEEVNLYRDAAGEKLAEGKSYDWDGYERNFYLDGSGLYGTNEIKLMRLMSKMSLAAIKKIKVEQDTIDRVYDIIRLWEN